MEKDVRKRKGEITLMKNVETLKSILEMVPNAFFDDKLLRNALIRSFATCKRTGRILYVIAESGIIDNAKMIGMVDEKTYKKYVNAIYEDYGIDKLLVKEHILYWLEALNIAYVSYPTETNDNTESNKSSETENNGDNEDINDTEAKRKQIEISFETLSLSEKKAAVCLFYELAGLEGKVVGSRISDKYKITRSIIVSALSKLESAGLIISRSMGKSGTYVKVLNPLIIDVLGKYSQKQAYINSYLKS